MYQEEKGSIKKVLSKPMIFENQNTIEVIDDAIKEMEILEESDDSEEEESVCGGKKKQEISL